MDPINSIEYSDRYQPVRTYPSILLWGGAVLGLVAASALLVYIYARMDFDVTVPESVVSEFQPVHSAVMPSLVIGGFKADTQLSTVGIGPLLRDALDRAADVHGVASLAVFLRSDTMVLTPNTAANLAEEQKSGIVIWGQYVNRVLSLNIYSPGKPEYTIAKFEKGERKRTQLQSPKSLLQLHSNDLQRDREFIAMLILSQAFYLSGHYQTAAEFFEKTLNLAKKLTQVELIPELYFYLGWLYQQEDNMDTQKSIQYYSKSMQLKKQSASYLYSNRGVARQLADDLTTAVQDYNRAIKMDPTNAVAYNNRANIREELGDIKGAYKDYYKAIKIDPQLNVAYYNLGKLDHAQGDLRSALNNFSNAIVVSENDADAYYNRGVVRQLLGDPVGAAEDYNATIKISPNEFDAHINRGVTRLTRQDNIGAIEDFSRSILISPDHASGYYNRAIAYQLVGYNDKALEDYDTAIRFQDDYFMAYNNRGTVKQVLQDWVGAIGDFSQAIRLKPDFAVAYVNRGNSRLNNGDAKAAIKDFDKALMLEPEYAEAFYNRGLAHQARKEYRLAIRDYNRTIALSPNNDKAYINRGAAKQAMGKLDPAMQDYNKAISLNPGYASAYNNRALVERMEAKDVQKAIRDFNKAILLDPSYAEAFFNRAGAHLMQNNLHLAESDRRKALMLKPKVINLAEKNKLRRDNNKRNTLTTVSTDTINAENK